MVRAIEPVGDGQDSEAINTPNVGHPRGYTHRDLAEARTTLTLFSTTTYAINGPNMPKQWCAAITNFKEPVLTQLKMAHTKGQLTI